MAVGLRFGRVAFYEARTLRFRAEVECRNRKGQYANGRKVTGLVWTKDCQSICVSTSDSRIRVIALSVRISETLPGRCGNRIENILVF